MKLTAEGERIVGCLAIIIMFGACCWGSFLVDQWRIDRAAKAIVKELRDNGALHQPTR